MRRSLLPRILKFFNFLLTFSLLQYVVNVLYTVLGEPLAAWVKV